MRLPRHSPARSEYGPQWTNMPNLSCRNHAIRSPPEAAQPAGQLAANARISSRAAKRERFCWSMKRSPGFRQVLAKITRGENEAALSGRSQFGAGISARLVPERIFVLHGYRAGIA